MTCEECQTLIQQDAKQHTRAVRAAVVKHFGECVECQIAAFPHLEQDLRSGNASFKKLTRSEAKKLALRRGETEIARDFDDPEFVESVFGKGATTNEPVDEAELERLDKNMDSAWGQLVHEQTASALEPIVEAAIVLMSAAIVSARTNEKPSLAKSEDIATEASNDMKAIMKVAMDNGNECLERTGSHVKAKVAMCSSMMRAVIAHITKTLDEIDRET